MFLMDYWLLIDQLWDTEHFLASMSDLFADTRALYFLVMSLMVFIVLEVLSRKDGIEPYLHNQPAALRWGLNYLLVLLILLFGIQEQPEEFINFQF